MRLVLVGVACVALLTTPVRAESVIASWYGPESGTKTASGERFDWRRPNNRGEWMCAHRRLPFGTRLRVMYGGKAIVCRIADRGPFVKGRSLDLAKGAADSLGMGGVARVTVEKVM